MYLDFAVGAWSWPQWTMFILSGLNMLLHAFLHGQKRTGEYSFPIALVASAITVFVLTAGGFYGAA